MADMSFTLEKPQEKLHGCTSRTSSENSERSPYPCVSCIDDTILPPQRKLSNIMMKKLTHAALVLAVISLICSFIMTVFGFFTSEQSDSSAMFGFAFDSFFALVSSSILIWRFSSIAQNNYAIAKRETHATAIVAICMIVSSIAIFIRAIDFLYHSKKPEKPVELLILASVSLFVYSILFLLKYKVANRLGSAALLTDAMDCLWGAVFSLSILICATILNYTSKVWYLDSSVAIIVAICSFAYGSVVLEKLVRLFKKREEIALEEYQKELLSIEEQDVHKKDKKQRK